MNLLLSRHLQLMLLFVFGTGVLLHGQNATEPNTTIFIYSDLNNNGTKEIDEPYLPGFSVTATGFDGQPIAFSEDQDGVFQGHVPRRARVVVDGYSSEHQEGNAEMGASASVFFAEPGTSDMVNYYVAISSGPNIDVDNQSIILPCYEGGPAEGRDGPALIEYGFMHDGVIEKLGGDAPNPNMLASIQEVGATWGLGMQQQAQKVYTSALVKRHVGLGPMGIGGLYQYDLANGSLASFDLQGLPTVNGGALNFGSIQRNVVPGDIQHDGSDNFALTMKDMVATYDIDVFDKVGKAGIGDIDVSEDGNTLWVVNLYDRSLVAIDVSSGEPDFNSIRSYPIMDQSGLPDLSFPFIQNLNAGGQGIGGAEAFTDLNKVAWERNKYSDGGEAGSVENVITNTMNSTEGTTEPILYRSFRQGSAFSYRIPVFYDGSYTVRLHFAEIDAQFGPGPNQRLFNVDAEGVNKLSNFDIFSEAGDLYKAHVEEFEVVVNDGVLDLSFNGQLVGNELSEALIAGIQVIGNPQNKVLSGELRPWGIAFHEGRGYLGLVSDGSITKLKDHLFGYVVSFDPENIAGGFNIELEFPLSYPRERSSYADSHKARPLRTSVWEAWVDTWEETGIELAADKDTMNLSYPQPIISDIDFDDQGHMIVGVMGRWAHQVGFMNYPPIPGKQVYLIGYASGDILKAVPSSTQGGNSFEIETDNNDTIPYYSNLDGPSYNGEFFYEDYFDSDRAHHGEIFTGGLGVMPGRNEVVLTVFNPILTNGNNNFEYNGVYTQGTHVYSTTDGSKQRASLFVDQYQFGKANGLGDIEFYYNLPDNNIGNYVWCDGNGDGIQDANEKGIPGVKLYLIQVDEEQGNQLVDSTMTDSAGLYLFENLKRTERYIVKIDLNQTALDGFQRKASPAFQGDDPRINSDGIDTLIPGCVIAEVNYPDMLYDYTYDFGLLGPESRDVTRTLCLEPGMTTAGFDLCEIDSAVRMPGVQNTLVEYYHSEEDAVAGSNPVSRTGQCGYETAGDTLYAKTFIAGDSLCYSLSTVQLVVSNPETDIVLEELACLGEAIDLEAMIDLNQDSLMVFTSASREPGDMIANINSFVPEQFPVILYFKATFALDCNAFGSLILNEVPSFEIALNDQASICEGELFYFSDLNVSFPSGGAAIDQLYWTTNGTGRFNSGSRFSQAQSYTPSEQDIQRGFIEFSLNASNFCYTEERTVYVNIITDRDVRIECLPTDTVYCFDPRISDPYHPDFPGPTAVLGCDRELTPTLNFVDIDMDHCDSAGDVSSRIIRHWEFSYKDIYSSFCSDTLVVFRLPKLTPDAFVGSSEDTFYCEIEPIPHTGELLKHYAAWKQPVGLHDYELPHSKLNGVTYELPQTVIEAGLQNAWQQGELVFRKYLECVILRKNDGTEVTIGDIVSGRYMRNLTGTTSSQQLGYGFLQSLIDGHDNPVNITLPGVAYNYYPYLLLESGDLILSEGGTFAKVDRNWFYNGHGNNPYWFSGGWPSIYANGQCVSYCDGGSHADFDCILIKIPSLGSVTGTGPESCDTICLTDVSDLCGITIEREEQPAWTGECPKTRGLTTRIVQTCWTDRPNSCAEDLTAEEIDLVASYDSTGKNIEITLSQWQTLIDTMGPIFDFCYATDWDQERIKTSIRSGVIDRAALEWERNNPTIYQTRDHSCDAAVLVPDVQVIDDCSGIHSVKAMVDVKGGTRAVAMELTATELKILANGDTCTVYTYSHTSDPIIIPMGNSKQEVKEVRYEAADNCWNQSTWSKFIRVVDRVPPTVVANTTLEFTLQSKKGWMNAIDIDEGSWDNCGDLLVLGRRVDWDEFCVDLCTDKIAHVTTLEELNNIDPLSVLDSGEIELYYRKMIEWLEDDEACGDRVVEGWIDGIRAHWASHCGPKDEHGNPLIEVPQHHLGGGWSKRIPFGCEDACQTVQVELLVMDQWCNYSISRATIYVREDVPAKKLVDLDDITITCDAYAKYYKPVLDLAIQSGSSDQDETVFKHLDNLLGGYQAVWENEKGEPVHMNGDVLPTAFSVVNTVCTDSVKEIRYQDTAHDNTIVWRTRNVPVTILEDVSEAYTRGYIGVNCGAEITQDIWPDLNDCGVGTIMRKFHVTTGCGDHKITKTYTQNITIEPTCTLRKQMISWPDDTQVCMNLTYDANGNANLPVSLVGKAEYTFPEGCRMMAIGYDDQVHDVIGNPNMKKVVRTYRVMDWCSGETLEHEQIVVVNNNCSTDGSTMTFAGTIVDPNENFIRGVTLNMQSRPTQKSSYFVEDGKYFMNIDENPEIVYLDKESSYRNGVSTLDVILLQRYLNNPSVFANPYQKVAADVNNNGLIERMDLAEIRNLVLGKQNAFVQVRPWRFVDKSTLKAYSRIETSSTYQENNWVGVKMGDVNFDSDYLIRTTSRNRQVVLPVVLEKSTDVNGHTRLVVKMTESIRLAGFQLSLDMNAIEHWSIHDKSVLNITDDHWSRDGNHIIISWNSVTHDQRLERDDVLLSFDLGKGTKEFNLDDVTLNAGFDSEIYTPELKKRPIALKYESESKELQVLLFPNPAEYYQTFEFSSPETSDALISIQSIDGKEIESFEVELQAGETIYHHNLTDRYTSGMYVYQIRTHDQVVTGRFEVIR